MNHSTITTGQASAIEAMLASMPNIPSGVGSKENDCSIAAINLALTGKLTDVIPDCMSVAIGRWIIKVQDSAPADLRNSERWRRLLPLAAGTGRDRDAERCSVALDWMWSVALPRLKPLADKHGFGESWQKMCDLRTDAAAYAAAAYAAAAYAAADADFWHSVDPCGCLERMINLPEGDRK